MHCSYCTTRSFSRLQLATHLDHILERMCEAIYACHKTLSKSKREVTNQPRKIFLAFVVNNIPQESLFRFISVSSRKQFHNMGGINGHYQIDGLIVLEGNPVLPDGIDGRRVQQGAVLKLSALRRGVEMNDQIALPGMIAQGIYFD